MFTPPTIVAAAAPRTRLSSRAAAFDFRHAPAAMPDRLCLLIRLMRVMPPLPRVAAMR